MPLNLIVGRANTGKTGAAYDAVRSAIKDGRMPVLVVPSVPDVERARGEFAREPSLGLAILTFDELVARLWEESGDGRAIIAPATNSMLLIRSLRAAGLGLGFRRTAERIADALAEQTGMRWRHVGNHATDPMEICLARYANELETRSAMISTEAASILAEQAGLHTEPLVVHRFDDFTASQVRLIRALATSSTVTVTLTWEEGFAPTAALDPLVGRLDPDHIYVTADRPFNTRPELVDLADGLFSGPRPLNPAGSVLLGVASGEDAQADLVVDVVEEALSAGAAPGRIAVALRSPERHAPALARAFSDAGIGAALDVTRSFGETSFGSAVMEALHAAMGDRPALMAVLRTPYSGLEPEDARDLEARVRRWGDIGASQARLYGSGALADVRRAVSEIERGNPAPLATVLGNMYAAAWRGDAADGGAAADAAAYRAAMRVLEAVRDVGEGVELADVLAVLSEQSVHVGGARADHVQVLPVTRLRGRRFDVVIVAGLNAGEFPAAPDESGLAGSRVHEIVRRFGGQGLQQNGPEFEQLLFYETITRATERVVLVGKDAGDEGEALPLSPFWEIVADRFSPERDGVVEMPGLLRREIAQPPRADARGRERLRAQARAHDTGERRVAAALRRATGRPGRLTEGQDLAPAVLSASQIESYLSCPYRWFYDNAIGGEELEREFDAVEEGNLAHDFLRRTYEELIAQGRACLTEAGLPVALSILERIASEREVSGTPRLAEHVGARLAKRWAARILEQDARVDSVFRPWKVEWSFGFDGDAVDLGGFSLRGTVDRIDVDSDGHAVITDYKRSAKDGLNGFALLDKRALQVLLYLEAVALSTGLEPVAGLYRGLKQDKVTGVVVADSEATALLTNRNASVSADELRELRETAVTLARGAVEGMRAGRIEPDPHDAKACTFCGARGVCEEA